MQKIHTIVPFSVLLAMREADHVPESAAEAFGHLASVRFGGSDTVAAQIKRYRDLLEKGVKTDVNEVTSLLRLVARRPDADLVFAEAGRISGRMTGDRAGLTARIGMGGRASRGYRTVRRLAGEVFSVEVRGPEYIEWNGSASLGNGELAGVSCRLIGAATAELLRIFADFDGALIHEQCVGRGQPSCVWNTEAHSEAQS